MFLKLTKKMDRYTIYIRLLLSKPPRRDPWQPKLRIATRKTPLIFVVDIGFPKQLYLSLLKVKFQFSKSHLSELFDIMVVLSIVATLFIHHEKILM